MGNQNQCVKVIGSLGLCASAIKITNLISYIDSVLVKRSHRVRLSHGQACAALILNFLSRKAYNGISNVERFAQEYPVSAMIGSLETSDAYSESTLGDTLDAVYTYGPVRLFTEFAAQCLNGKEVKIGHLDATSFHVHRQETEEEIFPEDFIGPMKKYSEDSKVIRFRYGHPKDKRDDLPQINVMGIAARVPGLKKAIPIYTSTFDGNVNDVKKMQEFAAHDMTRLHELYPELNVLVADSAAATPETITALSSQGISLISRLSDRRKEAAEAMRAFEAANPKDMKIVFSKDGQPVRLFPAGKHTFTDKKGNRATGRLIVVEAQTLRNTKTRTINKRAEKELTELQKALDRLYRRPAACRKDAERQFGECTEKLKYCTVTEPVYEERYGYAKRGRPHSDDERKVVSCSVKAQACIDRKLVEEAVNKELLYVLFAVNTDMGAEEIYNTYHRQTDIECTWRDMKDKNFYVPNFFVKKPERIQALFCLISMAVYISRLVENAVWTALENNNIIFHRTSGKKTKRPSFASISAVLQDIYVRYAGDRIELIFGQENTQSMMILALMNDSYREFYRGQTFFPYFCRSQQSQNDLSQEELSSAVQKQIEQYMAEQILLL